MNRIRASAKAGQRLKPALDVGTEILRRRGVRRLIFVFESPDLFCAIDLAQVVNTVVRLGSFARLNEIGDRDSSHQPDKWYQNDAQVTSDQAGHSQALTFENSRGALDPR